MIFSVWNVGQSTSPNKKVGHSMVVLIIIWTRVDVIGIKGIYEWGTEKKAACPLWDIQSVDLLSIVLLLHFVEL